MHWLKQTLSANYEVTGSRFFVAIYDDRLEIQNPGNFPPGMTIEDFKAGISKIRNPTIARVFREKENLEAWGSGFERIQNFCAKEGYPLPEWHEVGPVTRVVFRPIEAKLDKAPSRHQADSGKALSRHQVGAKKALSNVELKILGYCKSPKGVAEMLEYLGYSDRTKFKARYVNSLLEAGLLEMTDPNSLNSPKQKYKTRKDKQTK